MRRSLQYNPLPLSTSLSDANDSDLLTAKQGREINADLTSLAQNIQSLNSLLSTVQRRVDSINLGNGSGSDPQTVQMVQDLLDRLGVAETGLGQNVTQTDAIAGEVDSLESGVGALASSLSTLLAQLEVMGQETAQQSVGLHQVQSLMDSINAGLSDFQLRMTALNQQMEEETSAHAALVAAMAGAQTALDTQHNQVIAECDRNDAQDAAIAELTTAHKALTAEQVALSAAQTTLAATLAAHASQLTTQADHDTTQDQRLAALEQQTTDASAIDVAQTTAIANNARVLGEHEQSLRALEAHDAATAAELAQQATALEEQRATLTALQSAASATQTTLGVLSTSLTAAQTALGTVQQTIAAQSVALTNVQNQLNALSTALPKTMTAATASAAGTGGLVPVPAAGDQAKVLTGAGTWVTVYSPTNKPTATDVGLGGFTGLTPATLPISTLAQQALDLKATTASVDLKANIASPTFTGVPRAPTPATADNSTQIATTAMVQANISLLTVRLGKVEASLNTVLGKLLLPLLS